ncbi:MAG TPA: hypothetical protein VGV18_03915 [Verrucomicrobiae bacterium]|nr:hypothetical protein [Verrucomicrobiae bacterium]
MATDTAYLDDLERAIQLRYQCRAIHRQTVFVHEKTSANETVWSGNVELFDLIGCKDASRCYAWEDLRDGIRILTILHSNFVDSANRAVQAAIVCGAQRPQGKRTSSSNEPTPVSPVVTADTCRVHIFALKRETQERKDPKSSN